jgi:AhpC/TSA family/Disulphide bond corrector protein DsbC
MALARNFEDRGVQALVINVKETKAKTARWTKALGFTIPVLMDLNGKAATAWAPEGVLPDLPRDQIPIASNIIIDREGIIRFYSLLDSANYDARLISLTARLDELLAAEAEAPAAPPTMVSVHKPEPITLVAGGTAEARIRVSVAEGYKVQANPAANEFLIPAQLTLAADDGVRAGRPIYPSAQPYRLEGTTEDLLTYQDAFEIVVPLRARQTAEPGRHLLRGELRYQACNSRSCLVPAFAPVTLPVEVATATTAG